MLPTSSRSSTVISEKATPPSLSPSLPPRPTCSQREAVRGTEQRKSKRAARRAANSRQGMRRPCTAATSCKRGLGRRLCGRTGGEQLGLDTTHAHLSDLLPQPTVPMVLLPRVAVLPAAVLIMPGMVLLRAAMLRATAARAGRRTATAAGQPAHEVLVAEARTRLLLGRMGLLLDGCTTPAYCRDLGCRQSRGTSDAGRLRQPEGHREGQHVVIVVLGRFRRAGGTREG